MTQNGTYVIVAYKPKPGKEADLREVVRTHLDILRGEGLATDRPTITAQAADGTIIEGFEWTSPQAITDAHSNPRVLAMWKEFEAACDIVPLTQVPECSQMFAGFVAI